jgi:hypothetical protein
VPHVVPLEEYPSLLALASTRGPVYMKGVVQLKAAAVVREPAAAA